MPNKTEVPLNDSLGLNFLSQSQYESATKEIDELYFVPDDTDSKLANKVDKVVPSTGAIVYGAYANTGDGTFTLAESATAYTVVYRTSGGQINVAQTPVSDNNATSKKYVDDSIKDATITFTQGGVTKGSFTVNQSANATIALDASGIVDQSYNSTSSNAQSGKAVAEAVATKATITLRDWSINS